LHPFISGAFSLFPMAQKNPPDKLFWVKVGQLPQMHFAMFSFVLGTFI
jgi:hypothetical protein